MLALLVWKCARWNIDPTGASTYVNVQGGSETFPNIVAHGQIRATQCPGAHLNALLPGAPARYRESARAALRFHRPRMTEPAPASGAKRWSFLLQPKWIAGHLLVLFVAVVFVLLGFWQLHRNDQKHNKDAAAKAKYAAPAPALGAPGSNPPTGHARKQPAVTTRPAKRSCATGCTTARAATTCSPRSCSATGPQWWSTAAGSRATRGRPRTRAALAPPAGTVTVRGPVGASRPLQPEDTVDQQAGRTTLPRVDLDRMQQDTEYDLRGVYINAQYQNPRAGRTGCPRCRRRRRRTTSTTCSTPSSGSRSR